MEKLSVIIPTLNEASHLPATLKALRNSLVHEVIVVDGGSSDRTVEIARKSGCGVIDLEEGGRATQMNRGAEVATGSLLLFLHADTVVPSLALKRMKIAMSGGGGLVGGGFYASLRFSFSCIGHHQPPCWVAWPDVWSLSGRSGDLREERRV